jgi:hypothetical protein
MKTPPYELAAANFSFGRGESSRVVDNLAMRRAKENRLESRMLAALEALVRIENQRGEFGWKLDVVF